MATTQESMITVKTVVNAPVAKVWEVWSKPEHITKWCQASDDWHAPAASNELRDGGKFSTTMAAKDGSASFEFGGVYTAVKKHELIEYKMGDGRKVSIRFIEKDGKTEITESFDPETENSREMQQAGWQAILESFRSYCESVQ